MICIKNSIIFIFVGFLLGGSFFADAYSPDKTHSPLAEGSVELYNIFYPNNALTDEEKAWVSAGSADEDEPKSRVVHHFYDPINNEGLNGFESSKEWARDAGMQSLKRFRFGGGDYIFTWEEAINAYHRGDKEQAYKALGHIVHLIQDATVPAHVRQDPHMHIEVGSIKIESYGGSDPYEDASSKLDEPAIVDMESVSFSDLNEYFDNTADYTSTHFLSKDSLGFYEEPKITRIDSNYLYSKILEEEYRIARIYNELNTNFFDVDITFDSESFADPLVVNDYWTRLAPVAIENSAGVIKLFHDTVESEESSEEGFAFWEGAKDYAGSFYHGTRSIFEIASFVFNRHTPDVTINLTAAIQSKVPMRSIVDISQTYMERDEAKAAEKFAQQVHEAADEFVDSLLSNVEEEIVPEVEEPQETIEEPQDEPDEEIIPSTHLVVRVIDGDTIELENGERVRYIGIDAPELSADGGECFALEASKRNSDLVLNKYVLLEEGPDDRDVYGRLLRYIWRGDTLVNQSLIQSGHVYAYDFGFQHKFSQIFEDIEEIAKSEERGLWGEACQKKGGINFVIENADASSLLINEVRMQGDEFIEIFNPTDQDISLNGYHLAHYSKESKEWGDPSLTRSFLESVFVAAHNFYTITFSEEDQLDNDDGALALFAGSPELIGSVLIDAFGWGNEVSLSENSSFLEGLRDDESAARNINHRDIDNDNNRFDFSLTTTPTPGWGNVITSREPLFTVPVSVPLTVSSNLVINELQVNNSEFVELYNPTDIEINLDGYYFSYFSSSKNSWDDPYRNKAFPSEAKIQPGGYYLIGLKNYPILNNSVNADWQPYSSAQLSNSKGTIALFSEDPDENPVILPVDALAWGDVTSILKEETAATKPDEDKSITRDASHTDSNNNFLDFVQQDPTPMNSSGQSIAPFSLGAPQWASYQGTTQNTGLGNFDGPSWTSDLDVAVRWSVDLSNALANSSQPVVDFSGNVYVALGDTVYSLDSLGITRWSYTLAGGTAYHLALSYDSSTLYVTGSSFLAIESSTGTILNTTSIPGSFFTTPVIDEDSGDVFFSTREKVFSFDSDGELSWEKEWNEDIWGNNPSRVSEPLLYEGSLYIVAKTFSPRQSYLFEFNIDDGDVELELDLKDDNGIWRTEGSPSINNSGTLFIGYKQAGSRRGIAAFDLENDGEFLWKLHFGGQGAYNLPPAINTEELLYVYPQNKTETIFSLEWDEDSASAIPVFSVENLSKITTNTVIDSEDKIFIGTEDGFVYAISPDSTVADPQLFWKYDVGDSLRHLALGDDTLYALTQSGMLYAFGD